MGYEESCLSVSTNQRVDRLRAN